MTDSDDMEQVPPAAEHDGGTRRIDEGAADAGATLAALLHDLRELESYLTQRGRHTYELAQRFLDSARRNEGSRAFDERQATMLEYQHYIWHEIAGMINKLLVAYGDPAPDASDVDAPSHNGTT